MNKLTIGIISFVAGAAISSVSTFFIVKKKFEKQAEIYIQSQLAEDRKILKEKYDNISTEKKEEIANDAIDEYCEQVRKEKREYREAAKKYNTGIFTPFDPEDDGVKEALAKSKVDDNEPYQISEDRHYEDADSFDLKTLYYHPDAYDVADENGNLVDPAEYVGNKMFNEFVEDEECDEMFIRNEWLGMDINIIKEVVSR